MPHIDPTSAPATYDAPTALPSDPQQAAEWQNANRTWWESHPMRYDWKLPHDEKEFSAAFFDEVDRRFFREVRKMMPWRETPFEQLMRFPQLAEQDVLEIGVGMGSHAELLARHARSFTGIDLTDYAVRAVRARLQLRGLPGQIFRMDAEKLDIPDQSFDRIWSWGVIHHSSDTSAIAREMHRVLRPGGTATIMVYHRGIWNYYLMHGILRGLLDGSLIRTRSLHRTVQGHTDGAIARHYTRDELRSLFDGLFSIERFSSYGGKPELVPLPGGRVKNAVMACIPNPVSRFFLNTLGWGLFLVADLRRIDA